MSSAMVGRPTPVPAGGSSSSSSNSRSSSSSSVVTTTAGADKVKLNNKGVCPVFRCGKRFPTVQELYKHLGEAHMGDISGGGGGGGGGRGGEGGHAAATDEVGGKDLRALKGSLQDLDKGERLEVAAELVESSRSMDEKESVLLACAAKARFHSLSRLAVSAVAGGGFRRACPDVSLLSTLHRLFSL